VGFYLAARPIHNQLEVMHVVPISPWPFITATSIMFLLLSILNFFRYVPFSSYFIFISLVLFILALLLWSSDVVLESVELKMHTSLMQRSFSFAIILFIVSEVMFFFSFF
jgi:cytochrome c oxidase subunit 3